MESNWAEENLQTIRTLMERSAVYRRALAPIMLFAGALGAGGGSRRTFVSVWIRCGLLAPCGLARPWSPSPAPF